MRIFIAELILILFPLCPFHHARETVIDAVNTIFSKKNMIVN